MKVTLVLQDRMKQIVLTPESKAEKSILDLFEPLNKEKSVRFYSGVYEIEKCNGGFLREYDHNNSVILCIEDEKVV